MKDIREARVSVCIYKYIAKLGLRISRVENVSHSSVISSMSFSPDFVFLFFYLFKVLLFLIFLILQRHNHHFNVDKIYTFIETVCSTVEIVLNNHRPL